MAPLPYWPLATATHYSTFYKGWVSTVLVVHLFLFLKIIGMKEQNYNVSKAARVRIQTPNKLRNFHPGADCLMAIYPIAFAGGRRGGGGEREMYAGVSLQRVEERCLCKRYMHVLTFSLPAAHWTLPSHTTQLRSSAWYI